MKFYIYISNRMVAELFGCESAYAAYLKATEIADLTGETAHLVDGETGEVITSSDERYNDELDAYEDANLECGFDPYAGCYTDDC